MGLPTAPPVRYGVAPDVIYCNAKAIVTRTQYPSVCITRAKQSHSNCEKHYESNSHLILPLDLPPPLHFGFVHSCKAARPWGAAKCCHYECTMSSQIFQNAPSCRTHHEANGSLLALFKIGTPKKTRSAARKFDGNTTAACE